jgi:hypothetical protein
MVNEVVGGKWWGLRHIVFPELADPGGEIVGKSCRKVVKNIDGRPERQEDIAKVGADESSPPRHKNRSSGQAEHGSVPAVFPHRFIQ